jgi:hypothetical protein
MKKIQLICMKNYMVLLIIFLIAILPVLSMYHCHASEIEESNKIIITSGGNTENVGSMFLFPSEPISLSISEDLYDIEHVQLVIPIINQIYGMNMDDRPSVNHFPENFTGEPPTDHPFDGEQPNWNESPPNRDFNTILSQSEGFIVEGITLNSYIINESGYIPDTIVSGRILKEGDTSVVYIGVGAQDYFNVSVGGNIEINGTTFTVIGIFSNNTMNQYVFMNTSDAQDLMDFKESEVNMFYVYVDDENNLEEVNSAIQLLFPDLITRYANQTGFNPSMNDHLQPPDNSGESDYGLMTQGFEIIIFISAILIAILIKKQNGGSRKL